VSILRLGHFELYVTDLDEARRYYVDCLGFSVAHSTETTLYLRAAEEFDLWTLALTKADGPGLAHVAFRVAEAADLDRLEELHERLGAPAKRVAAGAEPGQGEALRCLAPDGIPVEFYFDFDEIAAHDAEGRVLLPMRRPEATRGIPPARIDHVNIRVPDVDESLRYWRDELGFSISEYIERDGKVFGAWTRRAPFTHDLALMAGDGTANHHVAYFLADSGGPARTADLLADHGYGDRIDFGPGRHGLSNAHFFYALDPSGNRVEFYAGDYVRDLDRPPIKWSWEDYNERGRAWWSADFPARFRETTPVNEVWP
jgi:catechol 2,3-dioxygenase